MGVKTARATATRARASPRAVAKAKSLGAKTQEDHLILLGEFLAVCKENHTRLKVEKCEFMQDTMQYLVFDIWYGWWTLAASKA